MPYQTEFPDFDPSTMPAIPAGFQDKSWRNEQMPFFLNEATGLGLWINYADVALREFDEAPRFALVALTASRGEWQIGDEVVQLETDDWSVLEASLPSFVAARATSLPEPILAEVTDLASGKAWVEALVAAGLMFHFDDEPSTIERIADSAPIFDPVGAYLVGKRVAALYDLTWPAGIDCPIGYALTLEGVAA